MTSTGFVMFFLGSSQAFYNFNYIRVVVTKRLFPKQEINFEEKRRVGIYHSADSVYKDINFNFNPPTKDKIVHVIEELINECN